MSKSPPIIYTWTDEAPALATHAFLPVIRSFAGAADVPVETRDISLAGRILAVFADVLDVGQRVPDDLAELGKLVETPEANIIKLPNISASVPQMKACIAELQRKGYALPDYPEEPSTDEERAVKARYDQVKGSAVNPVLRQGNSDRRAPASVKEFARAHPPRMRPWPEDSRTRVVTMHGGDFRANEKSITLGAATTARIEHVAASDGTVTVLKESLPLREGEILDATYMSKKALVAFFSEQIGEAKRQGVLFSLHLKATMMKVSDPIIFGYCVRVFFANVFSKHGDTLERLGVDANNGLGDLLSKIAELPEAERAPIEADIQAAYEHGPGLAMVDSDRGITNLHVPSDIIIDASMPPLIRDSGRMWNADGELEDCIAAIPDSSYAGIYDAVVRDCQEHGQFDPATMGSVPNVGLMAQKAEEYGSHDKTFQIPSDGRVRVVDANGGVLLEDRVEAGDIWRACQTKDAAVRDWVGLAVRRARATGSPAIFWLDRERAHDAQIIDKVDVYLTEEDTSGLDIRILAPVKAMRFSLERIRRGEDTISVTGNVLAGLPHRPLPHPGDRHERADAVHRPAPQGRGPLRDRRRRLRSQARAAIPEGGSPALGLARRVHGALRVAPAARRAVRQRRGARPRGRAGSGHGALSAGGALPSAERPRARQPREHVLPDAVLGRGARRAVVGARSRRALRNRGRVSRRGRRSESWPSSKRPRDRRRTSEAITCRIRSAPPRRCARARP